VPVGPEKQAEIITSISNGFGEALKELLETKHLYQKVSVKDIALYWSDLRKRYPSDKYGQIIPLFEKELLHSRYFPSSNLMVSVDRDNSTETHPTLIVANVKMFCTTCDSREAFSPIWMRELANELSKPVMMHGRTPAPMPLGTQIFYFTFQCQRCKKELISIIVRREGWNLALHGRSPMEQVDVPNYIPKPEQRLFRDALIAMHGGKILAALFYLRTFIEQFARRVTSTTGKETGDTIMEKYSATLPSVQRASMPSLRDWYGKLSEVLHHAREDEKLLEEALSAIENHFDIRRVFKISETIPNSHGS
jgi:hypothetical protein